MSKLSNDPHFYVTPGKDHRVEDFSTTYSGKLNKKETKQLLKEELENLIGLQDKLYADDRYAVLLIFQAMDAAGKDGTIKHVMSGVNPQGCQVFSFKQPSAEELDHDYLWRIYKRLPERGRIGIFNRSHYEEILITKVHPEIILRQKLPGITSVDSINRKFWENRYRQIRDMERHLSENGTLILKFFLHVSQEEQKQRFLKRIDDESKNWKFSINDLGERKYWDAYMNAYSDMITHTSTEYAPWYVIPADRKWFMRYAVGQILVEQLTGLNLKYPEIDDLTRKNLKEARHILENDQ